MSRVWAVILPDHGAEREKHTRFLAARAALAGELKTAASVARKPSLREYLLSRAIILLVGESLPVSLIS
jgi:hypothetical protein